MLGYMRERFRAISAEVGGGQLILRQGGVSSRPEIVSPRIVQDIDDQISVTRVASVENIAIAGSVPACMRVIELLQPFFFVNRIRWNQMNMTQISPRICRSVMAEPLVIELIACFVEGKFIPNGLDY